MTAGPHDVERDAHELVEFVVQMLDSGDEVELLDYDADSLCEGVLAKCASSLFALAQVCVGVSVVCVWFCLSV